MCVSDELPHREDPETRMSATELGELKWSATRSGFERMEIWAAILSDILKRWPTFLLMAAWFIFWGWFLVRVYEPKKRQGASEDGADPG